jgi:hypothetical protein
MKQQAIQYLAFDVHQATVVAKLVPPEPAEDPTQFLAVMRQRPSRPFSGVFGTLRSSRLSSRMTREGSTRFDRANFR